MIVVDYEILEIKMVLEKLGNFYSYLGMKKKNNIILVEHCFRYVVKEAKIFCPHCGRRIESLVGILLDEFGTPFIKAAKVCKCGYMPTLDELLEELD